MAKEGVGLTGRVHMVLRDVDGNIREERYGPNLVVTDGKEEVARLIGAVSGDAFTHIAIGIGTAAPAAGDTTLGSEVTSGGGSRTTCTKDVLTNSVTNDTARFVTTYNFTATFAVTESGVFNSSSTGDLLCRQTFSALNVGSGDSLTVTWQVRVG